jgi:hypothetical protein
MKNKFIILSRSMAVISALALVIGLSQVSLVYATPTSTGNSGGISGDDQGIGNSGGISGDDQGIGNSGGISGDDQGIGNSGGISGDDHVYQGTDTIPPVIDSMNNITTTADSSDGVVVTFTNPTAIDAVNGAVPVSCDPASGYLFPIGLTVVTCTAKDTTGNSASITFDVTVNSVTPTNTSYSITISPSVSSTGSGNITCGDGTCPASVYAGTSVTFTETPASDSTFTSWGGACSGTATTCTLTINADTSVSADFTVNSTPVTPETPAIVYGGGGGGSYSSGGSSIVTLATTTAPATTPILTCPLITTYMKFGGINNPTDVAKLQAFLKDSQGLDVTVNGIFDQQMENAVRAFQSKYMSQIMGPWGANQSSGYVYITTLKKVNEIACNTPLTLSPAELAIINAYKNSQTAGTNAGPTTPGTLNTPGTTNTGTTPLTPIIGQNGTSSNANVAAVGSFAGTWNNFWGSVWKSITKIF